MVKEPRPLHSRPIDPWNILRRHRPWVPYPDSLLDEVFGDFFDMVPASYYGGNHSVHGGNHIVPATKSDQNFRVQLDVSQFTPDEVKVRVLGRELIIEGSHEERRDDHGYISRSFTRRYTLPEDLDEMKVTCQMSRDAKMLKLEVPKKDAIEYTPQERVIAIEMEPPGDPTGSDAKKDEAVTVTDVKKGA